jgi:hypothetical protein
MSREQSDFRVKPVLFAAAALAALVAFTLVGVHAITLSQAPGARDQTAVSALSPIGEAEFESGNQLAAFRSDELRHLSGYGWGEGKKFAHIPIERAMELEK